MESESEETIALQSLTLENQSLEVTVQSADENADQTQVEEITESLARVEEGIAGSGRQPEPKTPRTGGPSPAEGGSTKLPSWNKLKTLAVFLLFRVVLPACDVVTDFLTGFLLCERGHIWWGVVTLVLIFCPFLAGMVKYLVKKKWPHYFEDPDAWHKTKLNKEASWLLPLVQPFV